MVIPWQEVRSQEVVGLNPRAVKGFSSCKFSVKVYLYNILVAEFVLNRCKLFNASIVSDVYVADVPQILIMIF